LAKIPESTVTLSIIIPAFNEGNRITPTLEEYASYFTKRYGSEVEIIVVLNGCTDNTHEIVSKFMGKVPQIRMIEFAQPLGKGGAIFEGFEAAYGKQFLFVDADNMVRAPEASILVGAMDTYDLVIGNRFGHVKQTTHQSIKRRLMSTLVRLWVRRTLGISYFDTQCGAKAIRASAWQRLRQKVKERGWIFDLDLLINANQMAMNVLEVPVKWLHVEEGSKLRPLEASVQLLLATLRLRRQKG
jgi:dolichyl-phosphate beta-glucosyltransferase